VWSELERLARVASAERRLAEIFAKELSGIDSDDPTTAELSRRTGQIFSDVGDSENALKWLRRAHAFEPESEELFSAIDALLVKEQKHAERVALMQAALDYREGHKRVALLHTVGDLLETKLGKPEEAIESFKAVLDVEPQDSVALDRLTALYQREDKSRDLAELYEQRADGAESAEKAAPFRLALAKLKRTKLSDVPGAIDQLEAIVHDVPWFSEAVTELESLEKELDHRARVIEILRPLYERGNAWERIVAQNRGRLEIATDKHERAGILRETAGLLEKEGGDLPGAFDSLRAAFDIDPEDAEIRAELERLARSVKRVDGFADALEEGARRTEDEITKRELVGSLARVYDADLDDPRRALVTYGRLAELSVGEAEPLEKMDELAVLLGDWTGLADVLDKRIADASDADAANLLRRLGQTKLEMLEDADGAVKAYERALELEPDSTATIDRLIPLYEEKDASERLVELFTRRVELAGPEENDLRYDLAVRAAARLQGPLANPRDAIASLGAALEVRPGDRAVLKSLEGLYRSEGLFDDLLENLKEQAAHAESTEARCDLRVAIGDLYKDKLDNRAEALAQYRLVLDESDAASTAALAAQKAVRKLAEDDEGLRLEATDILLPALRSSAAAGADATERNKERVAVLELKLSALAEPDARAAVLREISDVTDADLGDADGALTALLRSLEETPHDSALHAELERLAAKGADSKASFGRYADALTAKADHLLDAAVSRDLWVRVGRLAEEKLEDLARAASAYAKALDQASGDESEKDILSSLDRLYEKLGSHKELADVMERRLAFSSDVEQAELHYRTAKLQIHQFKEPTVGLGSLKQAIEKDGTHAGAREELEKLTEDKAMFEEVAETLEGVYRRAGDTKALASLFEKRIGFAAAPSDRLRLRLELARVLEDQASDPKAALAALLVALGDDPSDSDVLGEIERVAVMVDGWADACAAFEKAIAASTDLGGEQSSDLWVRAAGWRQNKLNDQQGAERDFEEALKHDKENEVILRSIEQIQRSPGRERDLVGTLRRLAVLPGIAGASELRREAKSIAEQQVDDRELAESILREMIASDEADAWALAELTELRKKAGDHKQVYELLVRRTELAADPASVRALRHEAAEVARKELADTKAATDLYEQIFEEEATDARAQTALRELYAETGKKKELGKLLERLIDVTDDKSRRAELRLEAAKVSDELEATSEAIDQLRAVLDDDPAHREAALFLSRLFEKTGRDEDLARLLGGQIELAAGRADLPGELEYRVRLAEVQENRLGDLEKAAATFEAILARDANHKGALIALARIQEKRGEKADAAKYLERLLALETEDEAVATAKRLAALFGELKDEDGVQRALEKGLAVRERDEEIRAKLRGLYERRKDWTKLAQLILGDARAATETADKVRLLKAAAEIQETNLKSPAVAADLLKEASDMVPGDRELLLALCDAYSESERGKQAVEVLQKIVDSYGGRRSKEVAVIHHRLARAYLADGNRIQALAELDTAFKIDPGSILVLRDLGVLALELADTDTEQKDAYVDRAGKTFKALLLQKLDDSASITKSEVFYYLADVAHRQKDDKRAIQMLERALDNDKNYERAKELLAKLKG
jgi:tetratricopeptide (TPR) repeat protein